MAEKKKKDKHGPPRSGSMAGLTPEEILARAARAKWRFKAAVRFVMQNLYWLSDIEDQELGDDVQKNILLLTRKKEKRTGLLSIQEKALLNKRAEWRTDLEKLHLSRMLSGLKCFRRYPNFVKEQLAAVTYFFYYGPDRTIVKQGHESISLFFIVSGEVLVSQMVLDPIMNVMEKRDLAIMGPGSMFGEVALLHNIPRTATIVSNTHLELLCLRKHEFNLILKSTVQQQWDDVKSAMNRFSYFADWDEIAIRECCILSKMKIYYPDQTVLGDGYGLKDFVYFIVKGKCRIIEHILVVPYTRGGKKTYKQYNTEESEPQEPEEEEEGEKGQSKDSQRKDSSRGPVTKETQTSEPKASPAPVLNLQAKTAPQISTTNLPKEVETHFMQVCFLHATGCFGIGESMRRRRVVAVTMMECLLIPRYWLMQRNKGNIWNRIQQFLNKHVPNSQQVFKEFVDSRKWLAYRKKLLHECHSKRKFPNSNNITSVPYQIRLTEDAGEEEEED